VLLTQENETKQKRGQPGARAEVEEPLVGTKSNLRMVHFVGTLSLCHLFIPACTHEDFFGVKLKDFTWMINLSTLYP
jgi:hypothetical protein